jgi:uncharacterized membrane protein (UPF0127 family)
MFFLSIAKFILCCFLLLTPQKTWANKANLVKITTEKGTYGYDVEIADTPQKREQGLMYRKTLGTHKGMLFIFDAPQKVGMWMKNTFIPLDIIFIDCNNKIVDWVSRVPHTTHISMSRQDVCFVLELNSGRGKKIALKAGDAVSFTWHKE